MRSRKVVHHRLVLKANALDGKVEKLLDRCRLVGGQIGFEWPRQLWAPLEVLAVVRGNRRQEESVQKLRLEAQILHFGVNLSAEIESRKLRGLQRVGLGHVVRNGSVPPRRRLSFVQQVKQLQQHAHELLARVDGNVLCAHRRLIAVRVKADNLEVLQNRVDGFIFGRHQRTHDECFKSSRPRHKPETTLWLIHAPATVPRCEHGCEDRLFNVIISLVDSRRGFCFRRFHLN
mmetsp:Transcript_33967/g.69441  ORF Transcript_33967/g.69441 Transcript_33967/m.69441 type:complete len:232 (-) Transcript_33967:1548-2243(-)